MSGFFSAREVEEKTRQVQQKKSVPDCFHCGLYKKVQSPRMAYTGQGQRKILVVAEAPGPDEDRNWRQLGYNEPTQLIGKAGEFYRERLKKIGINLDRDCWKINAVNCLPCDEKGGDFREPTPNEIACCRPMLDATINELKPEFIWLMGTKVLDSFFNEHFPVRTAALWRGLCIPDKQTGAYIMPLYHPSFVMRNQYDANRQALYMRDLRFAVDCLKLKPFKHVEPEIHSLTKYKDIIDILTETANSTPEFLFHDYETTGLKPQIDGMKILTMSFSVKPFQAFSFPYDWKNIWTAEQRAHIRSLWKEILLCPDIAKQAHNLKFEDLWTRHMFNIEPENLDWCSMIASHIIDNRSNFTNLNFQAYTNFGILPYGNVVKKFISGNPFNKLEQVPIMDLLEYGGLDSGIGRALVEKQKPIIEKIGRLQEAYDFFHDGALELSYVQDSGIHVDQTYYEEQEKRLTEEVKQLRSEISETEEAAQFFNITGRHLNINSDSDLSYLFYDHLKYKGERTEKGRYYKTDQDSLSQIKHPLIPKILKVKKIENAMIKYIRMFKREAYKGKLYPSNDLNIPVSMRGSVSAPSFQNVPVHDEEANKAVRRGIFASPGNCILEWDFSRIEVCVGCCYHHDPKMIEYVTNPATDMHRDAASDIWILAPDRITKDIRFHGGKNGWVFPQFYGDYYVDCARAMWRNCLDLKTTDGVVLRDHIRTQGINGYQAFENHCKEVERIFWEERFRVYNQWKIDINKFYNKYGYIESLMGFRYVGYMDKKQCSNLAIQGTAFHLLLWTLMRVSEIGRERGWKTRIMGQIHDSGVNDQELSEVREIVETITRVGTEEIREAFPWINVPLSIDFEITPVNGSWYEKEDLVL